MVGMKKEEMVGMKKEGRLDMNMNRNEGRKVR